MDTDTQNSHSYRHILIAIDFSVYADQVAQRAVDLARLYQARLTMVHAVEEPPLYSLEDDPIIPMDLELETQREALAREQLDALARRLGDEGLRREVLVGRPRDEIVDFARDEGIDLIVVGSHGRHGLDRLMGSTATGILNHAPCDVLAVRVAD
jgi:universal stress protein A